MVEYANTNIEYITNDPNQLYAGTIVDDALKNKVWSVKTGWHFIPNQRWANFLNPRQWFDLVTNHESFRLSKIEITVQNMIPLTDNLSIDQNTTFMSFNNTIYALGYQDNIYETVFVEGDNEEDLLWREGIKYKMTTSSTIAIQGKSYLPQYTHFLPMQLDKPLAIYGWDPMVFSNQLSELRPGKNAIQYGWSRSSADDDKWYSTGKWFSMSNMNDASNKPVFESFFTDYKLTIMTPSSKAKSSIRFNYLKDKRTKLQKHDTIWQHPIPNMFIKMIPIFGTKNQLLKHEAQVVITKKIYFDVTPRKQAGNFPQMVEAYADLNKFYGGLWATTDNVFKLAYTPAIRRPDRLGLPPYALIDSRDAPWYVKPTTSDEPMYPKK